MLDENAATTSLPSVLVKISSNASIDVGLRAGEAAAIDVGAVGRTAPARPAAPSSREAVQVEVLAVERRLIDLEVAGVESTPTGVWIASATQSGMLCVTRMNSIVNGPTVTRSRGCTGLSRARASMPCSSSFGSTSASVSGVP